LVLFRTFILLYHCEIIIGSFVVGIFVSLKYNLNES